MRVALASCDELPDWEVDDKPLIDAFCARGAEVLQPSWRDASMDWSSVDICLVRTTWDYTGSLPAFLGWTERVAEATRLYNSPEIIRWNSSKLYLRALEEKGLPIAPTRWVETDQSIRDLMEEAGWKRGFLKPVVGAGAESTLRFSLSGVDSAQKLLSETLQRCPMMLQPYLDRVEKDGEYSALFFGGELSHCVRKIPVPGDYRVQDDFGATDEAVAGPRGFVDLAERTMSALGFEPTYARVDALLDSEGAWVLNEIELIEPSLFFRHDPRAADMLVDTVLGKL
jgi:glutathione synthase/RimK-type ligase-like ATP-grasp enzyme